MKTKLRFGKSLGSTLPALLSVVGAAFAGGTWFLFESGSQTQRSAQAASDVRPGKNVGQDTKAVHSSTRDQISTAIAKHLITQSNGPNKVGKLPTVADLRKQYPFESLSRRLDYETRLKADRPQPKLTADAVKRLDQDQATQLANFLDVRRKSLEALHSANAERFIKQSGFGRTRMGFSPSPSYLPAPAVEPLPLAKGPRLTPDSTVTANVELPTKNAPTADNPFQMPSRTGLWDLHAGSRLGFLNPATFGFVKSREQVAGFASHAFSVMPQLHGASTTRQDKTRANIKRSEPRGWIIRKLELVSLLTHETPRAYVSDHLPRMDELSDAKTRRLTDLEFRGLRQLRDGEDIDIQATPNIIRMVGSLRATKRCMECHRVQRGELLGAFSYLLQRDPPIHVQPPSDIPAT